MKIMKKLDIVEIMLTLNGLVNGIDTLLDDMEFQSVPEYLTFDYIKAKDLIQSIEKDCPEFYDNSEDFYVVRN